MKKGLDVIKLDNIEYIRKDSIKSFEKAEKNDGMDYCIVRTYSAGVFAGYLKSRDGKEVEMINARRLWYWSGASSLSQLSMEGTKEPDNCKFPCMVNSVILTESIEILPCTEQAKLSIEKVRVWEQ